jgi:hypothetical protein
VTTSCPKCDTQLTWRTRTNHRCPPPQPTRTVRTYNIPKLIAWIGTETTSEIGPHE